MLGDSEGLMDGLRLGEKEADCDTDGEMLGDTDGEIDGDRLGLMDGLNEAL